MGGDHSPVMAAGQSSHREHARTFGILAAGTCVWRLRPNTWSTFDLVTSAVLALWIMLVTDSNKNKHRRNIPKHSQQLCQYPSTCPSECA